MNRRNFVKGAAAVAGFCGLAPSWLKAETLQQHKPALPYPGEPPFLGDTPAPEQSPADPSNLTVPYIHWFNFSVPPNRTAMQRMTFPHKFICERLCTSNPFFELKFLTRHPLKRTFQPVLSARSYMMGTPSMPTVSWLDFQPGEELLIAVTNRTASDSLSGYLGQEKDAICVTLIGAAVPPKIFDLNNYVGPIAHTAPVKKNLFKI